MLNATLPYDKLALKQSIKQVKQDLCHQFECNVDITSLSRQLTDHIDKILIALFRKHKLEQTGSFCLLALGSYGRRELQLYSDIDLLLLYYDNTPPTALQAAQLLIQDCWDIGLEVGHQLTTVSACAELASRDLSVISSILNMRLLCGRWLLMEALRYQTQPLHMWTSHDYFFAKQEEQHQRYKKYGETAYNLEPNVKYGPGGLRDLQILLNIGQRHFGITKLAEGIAFGFITDKEYDELMDCQRWLGRIRFALHMIARKNEERLLFDHQVKLAALFGYTDTEETLGIEQFMKAYFTIIKRCREVNEMLLQWFSEAIVHASKQMLTPLDTTFQLANQYIEVRYPNTFVKRPQALLELFLWLAKRPDIGGVRANTIRLIRQHLYLINPRFCNDSRTTQLFMEILKTANNPYTILRRMSRYGMLGRYLKSFAMVTGQMQYDLFHVYTVDQHTLFVIRNLARFNNPKYAQQFPLCCKIMPTIKKRVVLYLAALFHDIAKGRGGDHSELGAIEAQKFALRHALDTDEQTLLVWLVRNHLLMSHTAQRQDIYDPKTIATFCEELPKPDYLDYLYLLTVADICATNPTLWNTWKDSLLKELYLAASQTMQHQKETFDEASFIQKRKQKTLEILAKTEVDPIKVDALWKTFKGKYFLHESPKSIARHTQAILSCKQFPLVLIMPHHSEGGTEVFIYMPHRDERFTITTTVLSNHHTTIQEATILTCNNQFDLDIYIILDEKNQAFFDEKRTQYIRQSLTKQLANTQLPNVSKRRITRVQAHFNRPPQITYTNDNQNPYTRLFLITEDKPGLLAKISRVFLNENIYLHHAKIATAGERVEDMFYVTNQKGTQLTLEEQISLRKKLIKHLRQIDK